MLREALRDAARSRSASGQPCDGYQFLINRLDMKTAFIINIGTIDGGFCMIRNTLVVFTYRHIVEILKEGGSQAWKLNPSSANRCTYLVCTRNRYHEGAGPEEHHSAFLVAKITTVEVAPETSGNQKGPWRYIARFDEYALLDPPLLEVWKGEHNPVRYIPDIADLGIDVNTLKWTRRKKEDGVNATLEKTNGATPPNSNSLGQLMIDTKAELAAKLGISPDSIDLTIRG
jgi:hypothetical protein